VEPHTTKPATPWFAEVPHQSVQGGVVHRSTLKGVTSGIQQARKIRSQLAHTYILFEEKTDGRTIDKRAAGDAEKG